MGAASWSLGTGNKCMALPGRRRQLRERTGEEAAATPHPLGHRAGRGRRVRGFNLSWLRAVEINGMRVVEKGAPGEPGSPLPICAPGRGSGAWGTPDGWSTSKLRTFYFL